MHACSYYYLAFFNMLDSSYFSNRDSSVIDNCVVNRATKDEDDILFIVEKVKEPALQLSGLVKSLATAHPPFLFRGTVEP